MVTIDKEKLMQIVGFELGQRFSQECPKISTRMARAFLSTMKIQGDKITYTLPYYAEYVIEGSAPHIIRPKNANALKFQINNKTVFAKEVRHPGNAPNDFMRDVMNRELKDIIKMALKQSIIN